MMLIVKGRRGEVSFERPAPGLWSGRSQSRSEVQGRVIVVDRNGAPVVGVGQGFRSIRILSGEERERWHGQHLKLSCAGLGILWANTIWASPLWLVGCAAVVVGGAPPLFKRAGEKLSLRGRLSGELVMSLVAVGSLVLGQFFGAVIANWFYHLREWALAKTERRTRAEILGFSGSLSAQAWVLEDGTEHLVEVQALRVGQFVVVRAGEVVPVDGIVTDGFATVDQQALTGESRLIEVAEGDGIVASGAVVTGCLTIRATRTGPEMLVAQADGIFAKTQHYLAANTDSRGERFSDGLAYPALALGVLAGITGNSLRALGVLNSWPVCGIVVVASMSMLAHLRLAVRRGLLVRDARVFEQFANVDTVIFDKTGTLTDSEFSVQKVTVRRGFKEDHVLSLAAGAERPFHHPLARAIVREAERRELQIPPKAEGSLEIGFGVAMRVNGVPVHIGSRRFMRTEKIAVPKKLDEALKAAVDQGNTGVIIALDRRAAATIEFASPIRPAAVALISRIRKLGIQHIGMLSGDHPAPTEQLARELGVSSWVAEQLPDQKANYIASLQRQGKTVCYVGDGANDAIALKQANVSISMNRASRVAQESADVVLSELTEEKFKALVTLSRASEKNMFRSLAVNCAPLAVSLMGTAFLGFGYMSSVVYSNLGLGLGLVSATLPLAEKPAKAAEAMLRKEP